jgi:hypothetical protein
MIPTADASPRGVKAEEINPVQTQIRNQKLTFVL